MFGHEKARMFLLCSCMMMASLLALILSSLPAQAAEPFVFKQFGISYSLTMPDDHWFENQPLAPIVIRTLPGNEATAYCTEIVERAEDIGCALLSINECLITLNADLDPDLYTAALKHEAAHCRGWPADHPTD
jgi:hypothetical protein